MHTIIQQTQRCQQSGPNMRTGNSKRPGNQVSFGQQHKTSQLNIQNYQLVTMSSPRTLRSSEQLLLTVPRTMLTLSAKAFSVSAPSVWNSLTYNCRSAQLLSTFWRNLKTELFALLTVNINTQPNLCHLCASDSLASRDL